MKRIALIEKKKCNPAMCGDFLCMRVCPVNRRGDECITVDEDSKKPLIDEKLCIGCGICPKKCPFEAISIVNLPSKLNEDPVHRFGQNGFHLFNLPMPIFGKVVGIIGRNGIGKSTALSILAGIIKPNLGKDNFSATTRDLIEQYKGSELQNYFERLEKEEIVVSFKPQQVSLIPKSFSGTVRKLLKERDDKNQFDEITKKLELTNVLDRDVNQISGGELQRVAIAATVLKKANVYFFDEPTSYLDIKQRIKVSKFIKELADEKTAVLIIEHDLIILDYMTDYIHISYGKPGAFGVISSIQNTREGINEYLSGFLRKDNVRFRTNEINFEERPPLNLNKEAVKLVSWNNLSKKLGDFSLTGEKGELHKHYITGILGENGIGKSTFAKILAEEIEPETGAIEGSAVIAYKPQYIDTDSDETVRTFLSEAIKKFKTQLINPLELERYYDEKLHELSGGELQRDMIAKVLSKEADIYLLDEPSAYLDVEQRLVASKVIRKIAEDKGNAALIVDHDLLFMDYLSDDLIVFNGVPSKSGHVKGPFSMQEGMNLFLDSLKISMRRDHETKRPRINKLNSQLDREQKSTNKLYYSH